MRRNRQTNTSPCLCCVSRKIRCVIVQQEPRLCRSCQKRGEPQCPPNITPQERTRLARDAFSQHIQNAGNEGQQDAGQVLAATHVLMQPNRIPVGNAAHHFAQNPELAAQPIHEALQGMGQTNLQAAMPHSNEWMNAPHYAQHAVTAREPLHIPNQHWEQGRNGAVPQIHAPQHNFLGFHEHNFIQQPNGHANQLQLFNPAQKYELQYREQGAAIHSELGQASDDQYVAQAGAFHEEYGNHSHNA